MNGQREITSSILFLQRGFFSAGIVAPDGMRVYFSNGQER
jgi:hypothetical protein